MSGRFFKIVDKKLVPESYTPEQNASYDAFLLELAADPKKFDAAVKRVTQILRKRKKERKQ